MVCVNYADLPFSVTLEAYIDKYTSLVPYLGDTASGAAPSDPPPKDQTSKAISLQVRSNFGTVSSQFPNPPPQTGVVFDAAPAGKKFGDVLVDVRWPGSYSVGETVSAEFVGANPRVRIH